jgi:trafficking protein particle complex subunit 1
MLRKCSFPRDAAQMVLNTDAAAGDLREHMQHIYARIFVEYVVKNPLYVVGQPFK